MMNLTQNRVPDDWAKNEFQALRTFNTARNAKVLARWLVAIMLLGICCLFLPWQQNIYGTGGLTALDPANRPQEIHTSIAGRITGWKVLEGQYVEKGDTILTLAEIKDDYFDPDLLKRLTEQKVAKETSMVATQNQIEAIKRQLTALENGLNFSLQKSRNKVKQNRLKVMSDSADYEAEKVQYATARKQYDRYKALHEKDGLISLTDLEKRNLKLQETSAKLNSTRNKYYVAKNELINSIIELNSVEAEYADKISKAQSELGAKQSYMADAQSEFSKIRNKIANFEVRTSNYALTAPQSGYIIKALKVGLGETVKENEALVSILPEVKTKAVELYVKAMDVALISRNRKVRLQFDGWPVLQFSGWPNASVGTFGGKVKVIDYVASPSGQYRLLVVPDSLEDKWPDQLRLGSGAKGWVMLNDVPIWYELWRQVNGFPPTISKNEAEPAMGTEGKK